MSQIPPPQMPSDKNTSPSHGRPTLSIWAIASMCLGMASIPMTFILWIVLRMDHHDPIILIIPAISAALLGFIAIFSINNNPRRHGGRGFADIGIVTGVVALLIAILLPSMERPREKSGPHTLCIVNLKNLSVATYMYQQDYNGYFPSPASKTPTYNDWIYWQPGRDINKGMFTPYMGNTFLSKVYICPQDTTALKRPANTNQYSYSANVNIFITEDITAPSIPDKPLNYKMIRTPAEKIILVEEDSASIDDAAWEPQNWKAGSSKNALSVRHDRVAGSSPPPNWGRTNASFADGHSEPILRTDAMTPNHYDPLVPYLP